MKMLRARLYEHEKKRKKLETENQESNKADIGWGHQIRSYVLHPYRLVKDNRSGHESTNPDKVLNGEIDDFIESTKQLDDPKIFQEMLERNPKARTVPQIFIDDKLIGGYTDLIESYSE